MTKSRELKSTLPGSLAAVSGSGQDANTQAGVSDSDYTGLREKRNPELCSFCDGIATLIYRHATGDTPICFECARLFGFPVEPLG